MGGLFLDSGTITEQIEEPFSGRIPELEKRRRDVERASKPSWS
jgi:hypothetical protein